MCIGHFTAVSGDALNCNNPMLTADPNFNNQITYDNGGLIMGLPHQMENGFHLLKFFYTLA
jgi:hypothetical protein